jgi:ParB/RepB/Spo0J family partition protein
MARNKPKAAPADGASTAGNLQATWPFPTIPKSARAATVAEDESTGTTTPETPIERVHVDAIDLYTDPAKNQVTRIALEQLLESPFNPRTHFDEKALQELAETVREVGVMQPLLVRPVEIPSGWSITRGGETLQPYEIIFGHRRYRAARLAGVADVPTIIRGLTDAQAAQLQAIENLQRENLDPVEEARGYAHYLKVHGVSKDQLAQEIGLSRTHVYSRLKLATAAPAVLDALQAGEIYEENALRIARLPHVKLQLKALEAIRKDYRYDPDDGGKKSVRRIQDFLREKFTLQLREAIFDTKDGALVELAGACTVCPKRSGNAPEYADLANDPDKGYGGRQLTAGPDLCTDPDCFEAKKKAHLAIEAGKLTAKGKTVVTGGKARAAVSADGTFKGAYIALKDVKALLAASKKSGGTKAEDLEVVTIQDPRGGKMHQAVSVEALKAAGVKVAKPKNDGNGRSSWEEQQRKSNEARKLQEEHAAVATKVNTAILSAVRQAAAGKQLTPLAMQHIALIAFRGVEWNAKSLLATLHGVKNETALAKAIGSMPPEKLTTLLLDCALVHNVIASGYRDEKPDCLMALAKELGVDVAEIRKDVSGKAADTKTEDLLAGATTGESQDEDEAVEA